MSEMRPPAWDGVKIPDPPPLRPENRRVSRWPRVKCVRIRFYGYIGRGFRVTFHLTHDHDVTWTRVIGVQIGGWFFGAVKS